MKEEPLAPFVPDRFIGGDDAWTTIRVLHKLNKHLRQRVEKLEREVRRTHQGLLRLKEFFDWVRAERAPKKPLNQKIG